MDRLVYVEVLDRRGQLRARHRIDRLPATIGRGYGNDVMVDDRLVDAAHARLDADADGGLVLEDLGSVNGMHDPRSGGRVDRLRLASGGEVRLGATLIRFVEPGHPVPAAVREGRTDGVLAALADPRVALVVFVVTLAAVALSVWLETTERVSVADSLSGDVAIAFLLALWAGGWAFATRIVSGRFRFFGHLAVASAALLLGMLALTGEEYLTFLWPDGPGQALASIAVGFLIGGGALSAHLGLVGGLAPRRRTLVAAAVMAALLSLGLLSEWADRDEFSTTLDYAGALKPLRKGIVPGVTPRDFVARARELRAEVDSLALEEK